MAPMTHILVPKYAYDTNPCRNSWVGIIMPERGGMVRVKGLSLFEKQH